MMTQDDVERFRQWVDEGLRASREGNMDKARRCYEEVIAQGERPEYIAFGDPEGKRFVCLALLLIASLLKDHDDVDEAIRTAKRAMFYPDLRHFAHSILGQSYLKKDLVVEAEREYRQSLEWSPSESAIVSCLVSLGSICRHTGRKPEAQRYLERAIHYEPEEEEAHYNIGALFREEGHRDAAQEHLEKAVELDSDYGLAHYELGRLHLEAVYDASDRQSRRQAAEWSEHHLRRAIELRPDDIWNHAWLFHLHVVMERRRKADEFGRKMIATFPLSSLAHWVYGEFLAATEPPSQRGEALLRKAVALDPDDGASHLALGKALLRWGHRSEARTILEKAYQLGYDKAKFLWKTDVPPEWDNHL
ncbi:MAG: tetratricopeptide repeat protein [Pirellulales bacterium]|nr:tetratricopeptide repeat protein [Pirellulales bacterium]